MANSTSFNTMQHQTGIDLEHWSKITLNRQLKKQNTKEDNMLGFLAKPMTSHPVYNKNGFLKSNWQQITETPYQQCSSLIPIIILMQNIPQTSAKTERLQRMNSLRSSMKQITLLSKKTIELEGKLNSKLEPQTTIEKSNTTEDTKSFESEVLSPSRQGQTSLFLQKYQLLEKLGQGANGCVYRCRHKKTGKTYAAKKLKIEEEHVSDLKRNFINLKELHHSCLIKYKALYLDLQQHCGYLVMECFNKPSLSQCKISTEAELKEIIKQLVQALQHLHNRNICHRDIKPENILYCPTSKQVKIIDFDISKKTFQKGSRRDMLTMIGTPFYQAPEIFIGGGYDERVDLWALGVTIYKLVTGKTPFQSQYHSTTVKKIVKGQVHFDDKAWSNYTTFLKDFVSRLLRHAQERMSLKDASNHLWLSEANKLKRSATQIVVLHEEFHEEFNNKLKNALSREESTKLTRKLRSKRIDLIHKTQFQLSDSEQELQQVLGQVKFILI